MRFPSTAIASILHRISGVLLFLSLPLLALQVESLLAGTFLLASQQGWPSALWLLLIWSWLQHLLSGIRLLLADLHWGMDAVQARHTAWLTLVLAPLLTALLWLGAF